MKVWDLLTRLLHWTLVASVTVSWLSTLSLGIGLGPLHEPAGYLALAVVAVRCAWGFAGNRYAKFAQFVHGIRATWRYASLLPTRQAPRYLGHNPLGGWMVLALLSCVSAQGLSGWLLTTDTFWGSDWLGRVHEALAWLLLGLITLHLSGVLFSSWRHGENLVLAMFTGKKPVPRGNDIV